jgi:hypothetical protein
LFVFQVLPLLHVVDVLQLFGARRRQWRIQLSHALKIGPGVDVLIFNTFQIMQKLLTKIPNFTTKWYVLVLYFNNLWPNLHSKWLSGVRCAYIERRRGTTRETRLGELSPSVRFFRVLISDNYIQTEYPTIASYNASVVNFYNATDSLSCFENKYIFQHWKTT